MKAQFEKWLNVHHDIQEETFFGNFETENLHLKSGEQEEATAVYTGLQNTQASADDVERKFQVAKQPFDAQKVAMMSSSESLLMATGRSSAHHSHSRPLLRPEHSHESIDSGNKMHLIGAGTAASLPEASHASSTSLHDFFNDDLPAIVQKYLPDEEVAKAFIDELQSHFPVPVSIDMRGVMMG